MAEENKPGEQTSSATADTQNKLQSSKEHARKAAEDLKSAAGAFAEEYRGKAEQAWGEARGKAEQAWGDARSPRSYVPGRCGGVRSRKSDKGDIHGTRNWVRAGSGLPALSPKALRNDQREPSASQSCGPFRFARQRVGIDQRGPRVF